MYVLQFTVRSMHAWLPVSWGICLVCVPFPWFSFNRCLYPHLCGDQRLLGPYGTLHSGKEDRHNDWVDIDSGYAIIQPLVFERIFPTLFSLYVLHNEEQDSKYKRGIRILNKLDDVQLAKNLSMST